MITNFFLNAVAFVFNIVASVLNEATEWIGGIANSEVLSSVPTNIGYVFGNIMLLNDFLPITDLFAIALFAISFKAALFGYEVVLATSYFIGHVRRTYLTLRI